MPGMSAASALVRYFLLEYLLHYNLSTSQNAPMNDTSQVSFLFFNLLTF